MTLRVALTMRVGHNERMNRTQVHIHSDRCRKTSESLASALSHTQIDKAFSRPTSQAVAAAPAAEHTVGWMHSTETLRLSVAAFASNLKNKIDTILLLRAPQPPIIYQLNKTQANK